MSDSINLLSEQDYRHYIAGEELPFDGYSVHNGVYHPDDEQVQLQLSDAIWYARTYQSHPIDYDPLRSRDEELKKRPRFLIADWGLENNGELRHDHHQADKPYRRVILQGKEYFVPFTASSSVEARYGDHTLFCMGKYWQQPMPTYGGKKEKQAMSLTDWLSTPGVANFFDAYDKAESPPDFEAFMLDYILDRPPQTEGRNTRSRGLLGLFRREKESAQPQRMDDWEIKLQSAETRERLWQWIEQEGWKKDNTGTEFEGITLAKPNFAKKLADPEFRRMIFKLRAKELRYQIRDPQFELIAERLANLDNTHFRTMVRDALELGYFVYHDVYDNGVRGDPSIRGDVDLYRIEQMSEQLGLNEFWKNVRAQNPLYHELPMEDGRAERLFEITTPDESAMRQMDRAYHHGTDLFSSAWMQLNLSAAQLAFDFCNGREPTPELVREFRHKLEQGEITLDLEPAKLSMHQAAQPRRALTEREPNSRDFGNPHTRPLLSQYLRNAVELKQEEGWKEILEGFDEKLLQRIGVVTGGYYYMPWRSLDGGTHHPKYGLQETPGIDILVTPNADGTWTVVPRDSRTDLRLPSALVGVENDKDLQTRLASLRQKNLTSSMSDLELGAGEVGMFVHTGHFVGSSSTFAGAMMLAVSAVKLGEKGTDPSTLDRRRQQSLTTPTVGPSTYAERRRRKLGDDS